MQSPPIINDYANEIVQQKSKVCATFYEQQQTLICSLQTVGKQQFCEIRSSQDDVCEDSYFSFIHVLHFV